MIPFANRFHGHNSLRYVYKNGQVVRSHFATLKTTHNSHRSTPRIAVVVTKKILKSAVGRNRIRRRIYEYVRRQIPHLDKNLDVAIIVSTSEFLTMPAGDLEATMDDLFRQASLSKSSQD